MWGRATRRLVGLVLVAGLSGCVGYTPRPLATTPVLATRPVAPAGGVGHPLTLGDIDRFVLRNNPELAAARAKLGIGAAQLLVAGVLPNPQLTASYPFYVAGAGGTDAFALGVAQDLRSLLLRPTKREAAAAGAAEINASLLWQEHQTVGKARLLYVDLVSGERLGRLLDRSRRLMKQRFDFAKASIDQGNAPLATLAPDLVALSEVEKNADDLARQQLGRRHQLAALLGLAPDASVPLAGTPDLPPLDLRRLRADLASLANRRPDLLALQYGYRAQDARLRQAILAQFPNLVVGVLGGRDTSAIYSVGPQASFDLPIFDRNEGNIAVEQATREALQREFAARLTAATGEIEALVSEQALLRRQLAGLRPRLDQARAIADKADVAFKQGSFDPRAYVDVEVALLTLQQQDLLLRQALFENQVTLATLLGAGLPRAQLAPPPPADNPLGLLTAFSR